MDVFTKSFFEGLLNVAFDVEIPWGLDDGTKKDLFQFLVNLAQNFFKKIKLYFTKKKHKINFF